MSGISQHFKNASTLRKLSESGGAPLFAGQAWPSPALSQWAAMMLAACPTYLFTVYGDEESPGVADSATQAQIDTLLAAGVPDANIRWEYLEGESVFVMAEMASDAAMEGLTLARTDGIFAMDEMLSDAEMEGPTLQQEGGTTFVMAEMMSDTTMEAPTLARTAGTFSIAEMVSDTVMEGPELQIEASGNYYDFGFETGGMDSLSYSGSAYSHAVNGPDAVVAHIGSYMYAINTGYFEDPDDVYVGQGTLSITITTATGTMTVWVYCGGYSNPICRITAGGTYTQTNLVAGWQQVSHTFTGATNDPVSIKVDNSGGGYDDFRIDDIHIPIP